MSDVYTFWDETAQRTELHVNGWVLYGDDKDVAAVMAELNRLRRAGEDLRAHILEINKAVASAMERGMRP